MTVTELIEYLKRCEGDSRVYAQASDMMYDANEVICVREIRNITEDNDDIRAGVYLGLAD